MWELVFEGRKYLSLIQSLGGTNLQQYFYFFNGCVVQVSSSVPVLVMTYIWKSFLLGCQSGIRFYLLYKISVLFRICTQSSIFIHNVHFGFLSIFLSRLSSLICFSLELQFFNLFFSYVFLPLQVAEAFLVISYFICVFPQSIMRPFQS